ncbi:hypothetical protein E2C01_068841 [Portunus trituberculatus]|uniref:Uncharacterized protein n=1 Tax=Portunus trituberculatus TaxID=210409 RepID=A0A5B7HNG7_PORTR|nr:hypothetical protein [Portunus trituberculatus]
MKRCVSSEVGVPWRCVLRYVNTNCSGERDRVKQEKK